MATEKSTSTPGAPAPPPLLFLAGRNLAVIVLSEMLRAGSDRCSIEVNHREGMDQCDALARALEGLRTAPPAVIQGFAAVFTDRAGCDASVGPEHFERLTIQQMGIARASPPACH